MKLTKMKNKEQIILWAEMISDFSEIAKGRIAKQKNKKSKNPNLKNTNRWYNWNYGFNSM